MADEKKDEIEKLSETTEAPKSAQAPAETPAPAAAVDRAATAQEKKGESPVKKERPANCEGCKKSIKKILWYYRNSKYYCSKRCWSASTKKSEKTTEAPK